MALPDSLPAATDVVYDLIGLALRGGSREDREYNRVVSEADDTFIFDWHPVSKDEPYVWTENGELREAYVQGMTAHLPDGRRFYDIWPVDPKGTDADGWTLILNDDVIENIGTYGSYEEATEAAARHLKDL